MVKSIPSDIHEHMRPQDVTAFRQAAKLYGCYILVRRTNRASVDYIGAPGFVPKRIDCKFKTADRDFYHAGLKKELKVGGLVVLPDDGDLEYRKAFEKPNKYDKARAIWNKEQNRALVAPAPKTPLPTAGAGGPGKSWPPAPLPELAPKWSYIVDNNPDSERYGALIFMKSMTLGTRAYIHGDYDLYGLVPKDSPGENVFLEETLYGMNHNRGKLFKDVQYYVNDRIGVTMVLHGSQEKWADDLDDEVDVFFPDGERVEAKRGRMEIEALYREEFKGRPLFKKGAYEELTGLWRRMD